MKTKTLAVHSIQKNMVGSYIKDNTIFVMLATNKTLRIDAINELEATTIFNLVNYLPSQSDNLSNSLELSEEFTMYIFENNSKI